tara:strand:- start:81 stop:338 length:258 start_codon:yes stop_codon:yes gene_type:complete
MSKPFITQYYINTIKINKELQKISRDDYKKCPNIEKLIVLSVINRTEINYDLCDPPKKYSSPNKRDQTYGQKKRPRYFGEPYHVI